MAAEQEQQKRRRHEGEIASWEKLIPVAPASLLQKFSSGCQHSSGGAVSKHRDNDPNYEVDYLLVIARIIILLTLMIDSLLLLLMLKF